MKEKGIFIRIVAIIIAIIMVWGTGPAGTIAMASVSDVIEVDDIDSIDYEPIGDKESSIGGLAKGISLFSTPVSMVSRPQPDKPVTVGGLSVKLSDTTSLFQIEESQELWDRTVTPNGSQARTEYNVRTQKLTDPMPSGYSFGPRFRVGVSKAESFGGMNTADAIGYYVTLSGLSADSVVGKDSRAMRILAGDTSKKGTFGMLYKNVGTYQGRVIDCKLTIMDYEFTRYGGAISNGLVFIRGDRIGVAIMGLAWVDVKYDYFDAATGKPVNVKAYITINDLDAVQSMGIFKNRTNITGYYVPEYSSLRVEDSTTLFYWRADSVWRDDRSGHYAAHLQDSFSFTFEGSSQQQRFCAGFYSRKSNGINNERYKSPFLAEFPKSWKPADLDKMETTVTVTIDNVARPTTFTFPSTAYFSYVGAPVSRSPINPLEKYVSDVDETLTNPTRNDLRKNTLNSIAEQYTYHLYHTVPDEASENWYDSYAVSDTLADCLEAVDIKAYNYANADVTSLFTIVKDGQRITITAKNTKVASFYSQDYRFDIKTKIKDGYDMTPWIVTDNDGNKVYQIKNVGKVNIVRGNTPEESTTPETTTIVRNVNDRGLLVVNKTDVVSGEFLSGVEFTLYEWSVTSGKYVERERLAYYARTGDYRSMPLTGTIDNEGKYKVVETGRPKGYVGEWEKEFVMSADGELFEYDVTNKPTGENILGKTAIVTSPNGDVGEEHGVTDEPVVVEKGSTIQYRLHYSRESVVGYKSGEVVITDKLPKDAIFDKDTINLQGEILNPIHDSTAVIKSMKLDDDSVICVLEGFDDAEGALIAFDVKAPYKEALLTNVATLSSPDTPELKTPPVTHEVKVANLTIEKGSDPKAGTTIKATDKIEYWVKVLNDGEANAENVIIRDDIPKGTKYVDKSVACDIKDAKVYYDEKGNYVYAIIPVLAVDEEATLTFNVTVEESKLDVIKNVAKVKAVSETKDPLLEVEPEEGYVPSNEVEHPIKPVPTLIPTPTTTPKADGVANASGNTGISQAPKTGDNNRIALWLTLGVIALASGIGVLAYKKRKAVQTTK